MDPETFSNRFSARPSLVTHPCLECHFPVGSFSYLEANSQSMSGSPLFNIKGSFFVLFVLSIVCEG